MFDGVNWLWFVRLGFDAVTPEHSSYRKDWCWPFFAGGIGSIVGLGLAWFISRAFSTIFASAGAQSFRFSWSLDSFAAGWIWGTLLAVSLLWSASLFNSQINIVRALKGGRLNDQIRSPMGALSHPNHGSWWSCHQPCRPLFPRVGKWACLCCLCFARRLPHPDGDASSDLAIACIPRFQNNRGNAGSGTGLVIHSALLGSCSFSGRLHSLPLTPFALVWKPMNWLSLSLDFSRSSRGSWF